MVFTQVVEVAGNEWGVVWEVKGGIGRGAVGKMLKCSNQLVPRVERVGSHTLRRWLEHRREKYARGKGGLSVVKQQI